MTRVFGFWVLVIGLVVACTAFGAPRARIVSLLPPRADAAEQLLTMLIDVSDTRSIAEVTKPCDGQAVDARFDCMSQLLERPFASFSSYPFPADDAVLSVSVEGADMRVPYVRHSRFGESTEPNAGTAWLVLVDADHQLGKSRADAVALAKKLLDSMGPQDMVDVMLFDERQVVIDSHWHASAEKQPALDALHRDVVAARDYRSRALLQIIKAASVDGFRALEGAVPAGRAPLHRALVVLSNGHAGADPSSTGAGGAYLSRYLTAGVDSDDDVRALSAVSVVSVYFPRAVRDEWDQNAFEFMQSIVEPSVGGFFTIVRPGQATRAATIVERIRQRFATMELVKWRASCLTPGFAQSFELAFTDTKPSLVGDASYRSVRLPRGEVSLPVVVAEMAPNSPPVLPGAKLELAGDFCPHHDLERFEPYFDPGDPELANASVEAWRARGIKGKTVQLSDGAVTVLVPKSELVVLGSRAGAKVRFMLWDERARRASAVIESPAQLPVHPAPTRLDVRPLIPRRPPLLRQGWILSMGGGIGTALGGRQAADEDAFDWALAMRGSYLARGGSTLSMQLLQGFGGSDSELTTSRALLEAGWALTAERAVVEPYAGVGAALARSLSTELQAAGVLGVVGTLPASRRLLLTVGGDVVLLVPAAEVAVTGLFGIAFQP